RRGYAAAGPRRAAAGGPAGVLALFRSVGARDVDGSVVALSCHEDPPGVAADLAVLNEAAADVGLEIDLDLLAAVRAGDDELVHEGKQRSGSTRGQRPRSQRISLFFQEEKQSSGEDPPLLCSSRKKRDPCPPYPLLPLPQKSPRSS